MSSQTCRYVDWHPAAPLERLWYPAGSASPWFAAHRHSGILVQTKRQHTSMCWRLCLDTLSQSLLVSFESSFQNKPRGSSSHLEKRMEVMKAAEHGPLISTLFPNRFGQSIYWYCVSWLVFGFVSSATEKCRNIYLMNKLGISLEKKLCSAHFSANI